MNFLKSILTLFLISSGKHLRGTNTPSFICPIQNSWKDSLLEFQPINSNYQSQYSKSVVIYQNYNSKDLSTEEFLRFSTSYYQNPILNPIIIPNQTI
jgi:hypothetical protein